MLDPAKQLCRPIYIGSHSSTTQRTPHVPLLENAGSSKGALLSYFFPRWAVEVGIREDRSGPEGKMSTQRNPHVPLLKSAGSSKGALPSYFFPRWAVEVGIREDRSGPERKMTTQRNPLVPL